MAQKLKKFGLALLALSLLFANTDFVIGLLVGLAPIPPKSLFTATVIVANIEAVIWYWLGRELVSVLGSFYMPFLSLVRRQRVRLARQIGGWLVGFLKQFYSWEETKNGLMKR